MASVQQIDTTTYCGILKLNTFPFFIMCENSPPSFDAFIILCAFIPIYSLMFIIMIIHKFLYDIYYYLYDTYHSYMYRTFTLSELDELVDSDYSD